mmetsp:Transcript_25593/g.34648  ORF Transcript_25593/g.34648 Transcript_25593/m.34648 type:complete len:88 (-) Transcript_25593:55-318(-)
MPWELVRYAPRQLPGAQPSVCIGNPCLKALTSSSVRKVRTFSAPAMLSTGDLRAAAPVTREESFLRSSAPLAKWRSKMSRTSLWVTF